MSQRWINECLDRTGPCQEGTMEPYDSDVCPSKQYDSDYQDEANATAGEGRTQMCQPAEHSGGAFLPTRLLDLFPVPAHTPGCISLVESIHLEKGLRYAALSYCWGNVKPTILTTKANLDSHQQSIKFSVLPQCLRDAVTVARSLEIRSLWIDALCIIQGDGDDWARESATMWQLFQNAYVTIAAAASESFDEGFLARRPFESFDVNFMSALNPQAVGTFTLSTIPDPDGWQVLNPQYINRLSGDLRTCTPVPSFYCRPTYEEHGLNGIHGFHGLLLSCRTIYKEASALLYSHNRFIIRYWEKESLAPLRNLTPSSLSKLTYLKIVLNQASCHHKSPTVWNEDSMDVCHDSRRRDDEGGTDQAFDPVLCNAPLKIDQPRAKILFAEWHGTVAYMASHISPKTLELSVVCDVHHDDMEAARHAADPISLFPELRNCHIRLCRTSTPQLRRMAHDTVLEARRITSHGLRGTFQAWLDQPS
ncbi:hypothetical protein INS49_007024 [Diaporthe citri]|uniref:uncharacterized protein n=1 Tax=Diaporthe citri TaxID=83186 RepID=UPI001C7EE454|nr:uncharacterized protein INS49_007024 [Diaporthe citri]KAG6365413.1 hypothetical protein INS49_007024 [Diaporthe citri]